MRSLLTLALLAVAASAFAAEPHAAVTDPSQAGPDFPFVGEYVGAISVFDGRVWRTVPIGLQVVALGDGKFEAVEYMNGLPGAGWNGRDKAVLPGRREGNVVKIDAVPTGITLNGAVGRVGMPGSTTAVGSLHRINRASPTLGMRPPREATVLFNGRGTDQFKNAKLTEDGLLAQGAETIKPYSDFTMHVEYRLPFMPVSKDQGRANSGVYLQRRYEVQILDSFGQDAVFNGAGSIYRTKPADVNMSFPPLTWQSYDIRFHPAKFENGEKIANARVTIWHNGVKIHDGYELPNKTGAGKPEGPDPLPILLQDHNNPVRFRNVWIVDHTKHPNVDATPKIASPVYGLTPPGPLTGPYGRLVH
ncbi:MAG: DUF1080 domain-containing protein [Planctomycetota bacterium]|nr:DUF1080 domain-containing protein [Planctomycetota bacterium]